MRLRGIRSRINGQWLILGIIVAFVVYMVVGPLGMLVFSSFRTVRPSDPGPLTLANYAAAYLSGDTYALLWNTVLFTIVALAVGLPLGVGFAWLVERTNSPGRNVAFALIPLTMAIPGCCMLSPGFCCSALMPDS